MNEKKEFKYSVSAKASRNQTKSHEDANKTYGNGTSDFQSQNLGAEVFLTVRFDEISQIAGIIADDLPELDGLADRMLDHADGVACAHLQRRGVEIDLQVQEPKPAKEEHLHPFEQNPYPTVTALLKATALTKHEFAELKEIEERHGGIKGDGKIGPELIPKDVLIAWLRLYYAAREKKEGEAEKEASA